MYKVFVADDEPAAVKMICTIIERRCNDYEVCGTAGNGEDALKTIRKCKPNLVISDIRMPMMNGLEMAELIKAELPETYFVIVSGYQDFGYAQRAIRSSVADYLLKPISPAGLLRSLGHVTEKIRKDQYFVRNRILKKICFGEQVEEATLLQSFPCKRMYAGIIRENGLPKRFSYDSREEVFSGIEERFTIFGRDAMESLYLIPEELLDADDFQQYMHKILMRQKKKNAYQTLIYCTNAFSTQDLPEYIHTIYQALNEISTVGFTQIYRITEKKQMKPRTICRNNHEMDDFLQEIIGLAQLQRYDVLTEKIRNIYRKWSAEKRPQYWMEFYSRQIYYALCRCWNLEGKQPSVMEGDSMLEEAFYTAPSVDVLVENLFEIFFQKEDGSLDLKIDSPEFFQKMVLYLDAHLQEELSIQNICSWFGVSQTYVSKLFRKYCKHSFIQKLTEMRMEKAKHLMKENPKFYIKDIAEMVGYRDQFYFSRVFRSYVGKSPSEYVNEQECSDGGCPAV